MAQCKKCNAIIPDNREYCNKCMKEIDNPQSEDYLDNLLNQGGEQGDSGFVIGTHPVETSDERLDSMLAANLQTIEDMDIEEEDLENAFDFLISDSDEKVTKSETSKEEAVDDIDILEQIIDNFAYEEEEKGEEEFNYDSLIDEVLAQNTPVDNDTSDDSEIQSLLNSDFFDNLASNEEVVDENKEFELYDEETVVAKPNEEVGLADLLGGADATQSQDFVGEDDLASLLESLGADLGEDVSFAMDEEKQEKATEEFDYDDEDEYVKKSFKDKFLSLFMNKGEKTAIKKQSDIDVEEEELKNQLKLEKEERKKLKAELKKAKAEDKAIKKAAKDKLKADKKKERANRQVEVVVDEGKINKIGATIVFLFGVAICALILVGTNWFSYSNTVSRAKKYYEQGQYNEGYALIAGIELKEDDKQLYNELRIISKLYSEFEYYESAMSVKKKDDAIFHLVKGIRKYNANMEKAKELEVEDTYKEIYDKIIKAFKDEFSISEDRALEIAAMSDNDVAQIIKEYKEK